MLIILINYAYLNFRKIIVFILKPLLRYTYTIFAESLIELNMCVHFNNYFVHDLIN